MIINILKIIFLLGFLIFIHEGGHFLVAKLCQVKVNEFSIGFGPIILSKKRNETKYVLRLIPLGGFVKMEGEDEESKVEGAFNKVSIRKRIAIVVAGALVNILFGLILFFIIITIYTKNIVIGMQATSEFILSIVKSLKMIFTGGISLNDFSGPVGISEVITEATNIIEYIYIISVVSVSLGVTNLLPIPALDGGKILILIIEAIRKKPMNKELELKIQLMGFSFLIALSIYITYMDIVKIIN